MVRGVIDNISFSGCQQCDWISVIRSDHHASADRLPRPSACWINGVISLTDLLCVQRRQIGQPVPRWQLYRYGGDRRGSQGRAADSPRHLLEGPGLHWSSHVPEIQRFPEQRRLSGDLWEERPASVAHTGGKCLNVADTRSSVITGNLAGVWKESWGI